jgi:hypothetical protein
MIEEPQGIQVQVWEAMANHFLDTETRHDIPLTALRCVQAGLSVREAFEVWAYEVTPAVFLNIWSVAGEWAGWDRGWLVWSIQWSRGSWCNRIPFIRWLIYRMRVHLMHGVWVSIARCMTELLKRNSPIEQEQTANDLAALARHYFDFCPTKFADLAPPHRATLRGLYPTPFREMIAPAVGPGEAALAHIRMLKAFGSEYV